MDNKAKYVLIGGDYDGEMVSSYHYRQNRDYKGNYEPNNPFARVPIKPLRTTVSDGELPIVEPRQRVEVYFKHCLTQFFDGKGEPYRYWFYYVNEHINPDELDIEQTYLRLSRIYAKDIT